ncbi:flagellar hook-associated protein FlgK [Helicobacter saguini]|uniref:Flagellar hook-associated protein 1 n=1 Tax=Helicobacter saguini TaxID=1548018 RepID=A0A347VPV4_9HELI|nr:flagellar hook-associated protein FlgK [Helicobacter saguini]MWV61195.1 flagellar hook-associated protein FlgK [Helicobacter saguini]MWV68138.1 flagellar hook-associated protein FlgK [Helicobacter saguini]MWV70399.1 flagellar hook-associated protein FlgK [Helicobacter saguini]MWV72300.1 flagellar hook-associated protein FlgK [Helicobacter saguini]TLD95339.1 flagellar hook-associated protein FlgK [Helicobacter saguini]
MGGILSSLNTSTTGLHAHQLMVDVTGNNIANASNEFYTRQRVIAHPEKPLYYPDYNLGRGISVDAIQRLHDEFVFSRYSKAATEHNFFDEEFRTLREASTFFPDVEGVGIYNDLEEYFNSWKDIAKNPNDTAQKQVLAKNAMILARNLNDTKEKLVILQRKKSEELEAQIYDANKLGGQIAEINRKMKEMEDSLTLKQANELRDRRDELEFRLREILGGNVFKSKLKANNLVGSQDADFDEDYTFTIGHGFSMIDGANFHPIIIDKTNNAAGLNRLYIRGYDFKDKDITDKMDEGHVGALIDLYNNGYEGTKVGKLQQYMNLLDSFARGLIESTNTIYAQSGTEEIKSDILQLQKNEALRDTNYNIKTGKFTLYAYNANGQVLAEKVITIDVPTTMHDIVKQINANTDDNNNNNALDDFDDYFQAYFSDESKQFKIISKSPSKGLYVGLKDDGTNFTGAFGVNRFFSGWDASSINLEYEYRKDSTKIRPWLMPVDGNFDVANMMQQLQYDEVEFYQNKLDKKYMKLNEFYQFTTGAVANQTQEVKITLDTKKSVLEAVKKEHLAISQVSVDEEMVNLIKFQGGYAANAKVITTIDRMIETLLGIKQ